MVSAGLRSDTKTLRSTRASSGSRASRCSRCSCSGCRVMCASCFCASLHRICRRPGNRQRTALPAASLPGPQTLTLSSRSWDTPFRAAGGVAGGVAGRAGLGDPGLLGLAVRRARSLRAFSIWGRSEARNEKPSLHRSCYLSSPSTLRVRAGVRGPRAEPTSGHAVNEGRAHPPLPPPPRHVAKDGACQVPMWRSGCPAPSSLTLSPWAT